MSRLALLSLLLAFVLTLGAASPAPGQATGLPFPSLDQGPGSQGPSLDLAAIASHRVLPQGAQLPIAIVFDHAPGSHTWTNERPLPEGLSKFEFAVMTTITAEAPAGAVETNLPFLIWPEPHAFEADLGDGPTKYAAFEGLAYAYLPASIPADAPLGKTEIVIRVRHQTCDATTCAEPRTVELKVPIEIVALGQPAQPSPDAGSALSGFPVALYDRIAAGESAPQVVSFDLFGLEFSIDASGGGGFALLLLVAALGGFLLNMTPCVLPVIPLKIMGIAQHAEGHRLRTLWLGLVMSGGVVAFWLALSLAITSITGFTATNQLFQEPWFTLSVGVIIAIMAVGMCGLFAVRLPQFVYLVNPRGDTAFGSFLFGIMTAVLSTPCTAPFMGAAAAWAATQESWVTRLVFIAIGGGMALPYLVLSAFPGLVDKMPRTGPASELIKQVMGMLMLAAAAYFAGVGLSGLMITPPDPPSLIYWWGVGLFTASAGAWLAWRTIALKARAVARTIFVGLGLLVILAGLGIGVRMTDKGPVNWTYYTPERLTEAQRNGKVVVLEFTAEWCLNCKTLERLVLYTDTVSELLNSPGVAPIKIDLTGNNEMGNALLKSTGRLTIPLLVVQKADGTNVFESDYYTVEQVREAIDAAHAVP